MGEFERIPAKVERVRGIPRLFVDGRMMAPNLLMPIRGPQPEIYRSEIARAARPRGAAGVRVPRRHGGADGGRGACLRP